jgi:S1-C subfamily serine protease
MIKSAFKVIVKSYGKNFRQPWKHGESSSATGSGFAVEITVAGKKRKFVMTNAHVAKDNAFIHIMKWNSDKLYEAKLLNSGPEVDMAILEINHKDYKEFWDSVTVFPFGRVPNKGSAVHVVGFPLGGDNSSITRGIISRINITHYSGAVKNIVLQIDAAVNHGNSGGPVFDETGKRIVGIAFSGSSDGDLINYIIPTILIRHYLDRVSKTRTFSGVCGLMIQYSPIQNKTLQDQLLGKESGILVRNVAPTGSSGMVLEKHDILIAIDNISISNDGTIVVNDQYEPCSKPSDMYEKVPFWHYIRMKHPGESVELTFLRDGKKQMKKCTLQPIESIVPKIDLRISNEFCVIGGFVFLPLNYWHVYPRNTEVPASYFIGKRHLLPYTHDTYKEFDDQQIVILSDAVPSSITTGYDLQTYRIHTFNGEEVRNIKHLQQLCDEAKGIARLEFDYNAVALINMDDARKNHDDVLKHLGISKK